VTVADMMHEGINKHNFYVKGYLDAVDLQGISNLLSWLWSSDWFPLVTRSKGAELR